MGESGATGAAGFYRFGRFELNAATRQLLAAGEPVALGARAFDVLVALVERRDRVVTKDELLEIAWPEVVVEENNLQVQISALRKVLGTQAISTLAGRGYRFTLSLNEEPPPSPAGDVKPEPTAASPSARRRRWLIPALAGVLLLAVAGAWWSAKREPSGQAGADPKSIAVLPFANMSSDKDNVHFADGMQEELLTQLALLGELKVVSRTSVAEYRDTRKNLRQIGTELGVTSLVEGSVRRAGERVRVTVQLIDARTDKHVWGNTYDRELKDIFAIQSELSTEIARALKVSLSPRDEARIARKPTENLQAYELLLRADESYGAALTGLNVGEGLMERIELLSRAVALDPNFALAWSRLAVEHARAHFWAHDPRPSRVKQAQEAIERALALAPDDLSVRSAAGNVYYYAYSDFDRAAEHFESLLRIAPNHVQTLIQLSWVRRRQGRWIDANALLERALSVDARNVHALAHLSENLLFFRHFDRALALQRRILELRPSIDAQAKLHEIESAPTGSFKAYDRWRATLKPGVERTSLSVWLMDARRAVAQRDFDAVLRLCDRAPGQLEAGSALVVGEYRALALLAKGDRAQAFETARSLMREAMRTLEKHVADRGLLIERVAFAKAILGDRTGALGDLEQLRRFYGTHDAIESEKFAEVEVTVYALLGERQRALELLRARTKRPMISSLWWTPNARNREPYYVRLWDDPEFQALVADPANWAPLPIVNEHSRPAAPKTRGV